MRLIEQRTQVTNAFTSDWKKLSQATNNYANQLDQAFLQGNRSVYADVDRVKEEQWTVTVSASIYAFRKESDNDYHVILGDSPTTTSRSPLPRQRATATPSPVGPAANRSPTSSAKRNSTA